MAINLHFTEEDWARIERDWAAWWAGELDRPLVVVETVDPSREADLPPFVGFASNFPLDTPAEEVLGHYQAHLEARWFHGDAFPKWWPNFGPGIAAGFLGARVHSVPETVWFEPAEETPLERLHFRYDPENPWWRRVRDLIARAVERWGGKVSVAHTDLGGNLDILASFRTTQQLLLDVCDAPEEVARLAGEITRLWLRYYEELYALIAPAGRGTTPWAAIRSAGKCYMLQCDFSYMISPAMFERFVLPDLAACCDLLDHGFYHLDGKGEIPHLEMLLSLERMRGIQWVPGDGAPPPEEWLPLLKRIKDAGKLCQVYVCPDGARRIARELGGRGFVFQVGFDGTPDQADDLVRTIVAEGKGR